MQPKFLLIAGGAALGLATPAAAQMDHSNMPGMKMPPPKAPAVKTYGPPRLQGGF
jgi:copper resistance protein B